MVKTNILNKDMNTKQTRNQITAGFKTVKSSSSDVRDQVSNSWLLNQTHLSNQSSDKQLISSPNRLLGFQTAD